MMMQNNDHIHRHNPYGSGRLYNLRDVASNESSAVDLGSYPESLLDARCDRTRSKSPLDHNLEKFKTTKSNTIDTIS